MVGHGSTFVRIDKVTNPQNGEDALLIQDDGDGMDPESLHSCMSFGFSNKQSDSSIGQYGNGFKTSTMRLGADAVVFSRSKNNRTSSVGLLSYTFLRHSLADDIVVPMVDYISNSPTEYRRVVRGGQRQCDSNLSAILKWSPFATEVELLKQFDGIGLHGTKIIVFNLWFKDDGCMELDFESDAEDIMVGGAPKIEKNNKKEKLLNQMHIANRCRYSLRAYSSILYMHLPENFKIILRGKVVEPHHLAADLRYVECIRYRPQRGGGDEVTTQIGYLDGSPALNVHGFSIYHRNRLILPFLSVLGNGSFKCKGVSGVLEANFIRPTHDKQGFEKSSLYQKLETRLREMTTEYWNLHCHLVGYSSNKHLHSTPGPSVGPTQMLTFGYGTSLSGVHDPSRQLSLSATRSGARMLLTNPGPSNFDTSSPPSVTGASQDLLGNDSCSSSPQSGLTEKRKCEDLIAREDASKKQAVSGGVIAGPGNNHMGQHGYSGEQTPTQAEMILIEANKKLHAECSEYKMTEEQLLLKVEKLQGELREVEQVYRMIVIELERLTRVEDFKAQ